MAIWNFIKDKAAIERLKDEAIHVAAMEEINSGRRRDGLWTKAIIESNGDESRTKIAYLRLLVTAIRDDIYLAQRGEELFSAKQPPPANPTSHSSKSTHRPQPQAHTTGSHTPPGPTEDELMRHYSIARDGSQYVYGTYRFSELKHALSHARHVESLKQGA